MARTLLCAGSCPSHLYRCSTVTVWSANAAFVYAFACVYYLIVTRTAGTPFTDSLSEKQIVLKRRSAEVRGSAFVVGLLVGCFFVTALAPFRPLREPL